MAPGMPDGSLRRGGSSPGPFLQTVDKALEVLWAIVAAEQPVGVTALARQFGINPSTMYRILATLKKHHLVEQDSETARYSPGIGLLNLSGPVWAKLDLRKVARPVMERLAEDTGESVNLMIPGNDMGLYIDSVEGTQPIRHVVPVGSREHYHCSAVGKAILAHLPEGEILEFLERAPLVRATHKTITDKALLVEHLRLIRERGYSIDDEEGVEGTRCVGAPIRDEFGRVAGALSVAGPVFRMSFARLEEIAPRVTEAAAEISSLLGYSDQAHGGEERLGPG